MRQFAALFESLDTTTSTAAKQEALEVYFAHVPPADAAWATYTLIGRRVKRLVGPALLRRWLYEESALPGWLVDETYASVGDLAETIALLVTGSSGACAPDLSLSDWFTERILPLAFADEGEKRRTVVRWWHELPPAECLILNKLLTGSLRLGVARSLVTRALAAYLGQPRMAIERALMGDWQPSAEFWAALRSEDAQRDLAHPYPFFLASPLEGRPEDLGPRERWLVEWKWDGIRGQLVRRGDQSALWSRGEELVTERFPEIAAAAAALPSGTVLDGEIVAGSSERLLPFAKLQQRIARKKLNAALLEEIPVRFIAYDLLECAGTDYRARPLRERRLRLEALVPHALRPVLEVSPRLTEASWEALASARQHARLRGVEGLMLKELSSAYGSGRQRGAWWKWKLDPYLFDAVLLYAAPGHGRRSNLYTDYTFGVWAQGVLVPIAKAYSGLDDSQIQQLDAWIRRHTKERFGTVRSVEPAHVFELAYEGIAKSSRHKGGIALRFPRIVRWRTDKSAAEANQLADLQRVLAEQDAR